MEKAWEKTEEEEMKRQEEDREAMRVRVEEERRKIKERERIKKEGEFWNMQSRRDQQLIEGKAEQARRELLKNQYGYSGSKDKDTNQETKHRMQWMELEMKKMREQIKLLTGKKERSHGRTYEEWERRAREDADRRSKQEGQGIGSRNKVRARKERSWSKSRSKNRYRDERRDRSRRRRKNKSCYKEERRERSSRHCSGG
jgi:hypothetical protein